MRKNDSGKAALLLIAIVGSMSTASVEAQNKPWNQPAAQPKANLPETTKLEQNDNLDPTLNRTEAMRAEAESGSIAPITGQPLIQNKSNPQPKTSPLKKGGKVVRTY